MAEAKNLEVKLESTLDSVDAAEEAVRRFAEQKGLSEDDVHQIGMAVRESVVNAVVHGNRYNSQKMVSLTAEATGERLTITVRDQGEGFELQEVPDPLAAAKGHGGDARPGRADCFLPAACRPTSS